MAVKFIGVILVGYLVGAIPCGLVIARLLKGIDVRKYGSGKTGAANVLRAAGTKAGALTMVADIAKGAAAVGLASLIIGSETTTLGGYQLGLKAGQVAAAWAAMAGHNWPVYLKFQGGRGVDTYFGGLIAMSPAIGLSCGALTLIIMALTRYVSLGSLLGTAISLLVILVLALLGKQPMEYSIYSGAATILILAQHRDNIQRLRAGKERKIGEKAEMRGEE